MPDDDPLNLTVSLSAERAHDRLCDELERGWQAGQPPRIEELLARVSSHQQRDLFVALLLVEFEYRPRPLPLEEYRARFPQFAILVDRLLHDPAGLTGDLTPSLLDVPVPPTIKGLEVLGIIATGGMGVVFRAWDVANERSVAIKMIKSGVSGNSEYLKRFQLEAWAVAQLTHPGVVRLYSFGEREGVPHYVMEFVEGGSLNDCLDGQAKDPRWSASLVEQLARTMQYVHDRGIVHRDLKPANVLMASESDEDVRDNGQQLIPKITDFGLAKCLTNPETGLTVPGQVVGTASYMSPEQAGGLAEVGKPADIYALGAILFELLTGKPPFRGTTREMTVAMVCNDDPPYPSDFNPTVPSDLETICLRCLEKDPARRYLSADDLAEDLHRWQNGRPIIARPVRGPERDARLASRIGFQIAGLLGTTGCTALYSAIQTSIDRRVTLKLSTGRAGSPQHDVVKREAAVLKMLESPYVLRLLDYGEQYGQPYIVLDHVEGGVLLSRVLRDEVVGKSNRKPVPPRRAAELCLMIAVGVQSFHDQGVMHGGLHSGSVLLSRDMNVKLIGFESARRLNEPMVGDLRSAPKGVPTAFIAPESLAGNADHVGRAIDVYGIGAILYDLLTGQPPFVAASDDEARDLVANQLPISPSQIEPSVPIALEAICLRALNKDPARRFLTAGAIAFDLQRFLKPTDPSDDTTVDPPNSASPLKPVPAHSFQLRFLSGQTKVGERIVLSQRQIKIGRSRECDISLDDDKISRLHCGCVWSEEEGRHQLVDYGGKNGSFVNGVLVKGQQILFVGDLIQLSTYVLQYETAAH